MLNFQIARDERQQTSVPRTSNPSITSQYALHKRGSIMGAPGTHSCDLPAHITQQDLPLVNTLDFDLTFLAGLEVEAAEALQFILLGHNSGCREKLSRKPLQVQLLMNWTWCGVAGEWLHEVCQSEKRSRRGHRFLMRLGGRK